ncbi:MAG: response regulator transcription factor [Nocardioidaceae bacterium]
MTAARDVFEHLAAGPDVLRADALLSSRTPVDGQPHLLTERELEVLQLVIAGRSNREIASALTISEHTVARHLQNMFGKLGVTSRTAAATFAFEHNLIPRLRGQE